jgi:hypothetical protein
MKEYPNSRSWESMVTNMEDNSLATVIGVFLIGIVFSVGFGAITLYCLFHGRLLFAFGIGFWSAMGFMAVITSVKEMRRRINNHRSRRRATKVAKSWVHAQPFWSWNSNLKILTVLCFGFGYVAVWLGVGLDDHYSYYKMVLDGELNIMSVTQYQESPYTEDVQND